MASYSHDSLTYLRQGGFFKLTLFTRPSKRYVQNRLERKFWNPLYGSIGCVRAN